MIEKQRGMLPSLLGIDPGPREASWPIFSA